MLLKDRFMHWLGSKHGHQLMHLTIEQGYYFYDICVECSESVKKHPDDMKKTRCENCLETRLK